MGAVVLNNPANSGTRIDRLTIERLTRDRADLVLHVRTLGQVGISVLRGERMLRVRHGLELRPPTTSRRTQWLAAPPHVKLLGVGSDTGTFGNGALVEALGR